MNVCSAFNHYLLVNPFFMLQISHGHARNSWPITTHLTGAFCPEPPSEVKLCCIPQRNLGEMLLEKDQGVSSWDLTSGMASCALLQGAFGEDSRKQRCPQPASRWALGADHRCASRFFQITSGFAGTLRYPESARTLERGPTQAPPTPTPQPSQNALPQRPDVPGFLAVPQARRRCLLSVGFTPGRGGPTSPQPLSRVTGEVKDRLLRSSTRTLRMPEEAAAWSSCPAYRQKNIYICFIDYTKAFDSVDHNKLWKIL